MSDCSLGISRRAALLRAIVLNSQVLILDEPSLGLDCVAKETLIRELKALRASGRTLLFATHDSDLQAQLATHVLVLDQGMIQSDLAELI